MSSGGLPPKAPPMVAQTKSSRLLSRRHQSSNGNINSTSTPRQNAPSTVANETGSLSFGISSQHPAARRYSNFSNVNQNRGGIGSFRRSNHSFSLAADVTTPRGSRLSLPSIGPSSSSRHGRVESRWRTNPSQDYFNELGMVLDSDESPDLSEREPRVTPRYTQTNGPNQDLTNQPVPTSSNYNFPMTRNSLLSSRSNERRNTITDSLRNTSEQVDIPARETSVSRNEISIPGGSSEFSQVLSEIYTNNDSSGNNSTNSMANSNNITVVTTNAAPRGAPLVSSATSTPRQPMINIAGVQSTRATRRVPTSDDYDVESVDDVLSRIRLQNNLPAQSSQPVVLQTSTLNVNSSSSSSHSANSTTSVYSPSVASRASATSSNSGNEAASDGSTGTARARPITNVNEPMQIASTRTSSLANLASSETVQTRLDNSERNNQTPRAPIVSTDTSQSASSGVLQRIIRPINENQVTCNDHTNSILRVNESFASANQQPSGQTSLSTSVSRPNLTYGTTESSQPVREIGIRSNEINRTNTSSFQRRRISQTFDFNPSRTRENSDLDEDEIRAILATPPTERSNPIFDDGPPVNSVTTTTLPPVRNPATSVPESSENSSSSSVRPVAASSNPNRNIIGVRFTTTFNEFASGTSGNRVLRASSDTNNIFSSDESDDDDESVAGSAPTATAQDRIPHLDSHIGILHLLGLDLPQSTTEVILMNQRSILEQLLETYITLMASLQSAETEQRPAGLSLDAIKTLPQEPITKQQVGENITCSICLANFEVEELSTKLPECSHFFHHPCISNWLQKSPTCPMCRTPVHINN